MNIAGLDEIGVVVEVESEGRGGIAFKKSAATGLENFLTGTNIEVDIDTILGVTVVVAATMVVVVVGGSLDFGIEFIEVEDGLGIDDGDGDGDRVVGNLDF